MFSTLWAAKERRDSHLELEIKTGPFHWPVLQWAEIEEDYILQYVAAFV